MIVVEYPESVKAEAKRLGVDLGNSAQYDPSHDLRALSYQVNGPRIHGDLRPIYGRTQADFNYGRGGSSYMGEKDCWGFEPEGATRFGVGPSKILNFGSDPQPNLGSILTGAATAFHLPLGTSAVTALQAADQLLGNPNIANAAQIVSNTKSLAALGDPAAQRAVPILAAVAQIRNAKGAATGTPAVPPGAIDISAFTKTQSPQQVKALAAAADANQKKHWWQRIFGWIHKPKTVIKVPAPTASKPV